MTSMLLDGLLRDAAPTGAAIAPVDTELTIGPLTMITANKKIDVKYCNKNPIPMACDVVMK
jgi:hypothetical protein